MTPPLLFLNRKGPYSPLHELSISIPGVWVARHKLLTLAFFITIFDKKYRFCKHSVNSTLIVYFLVFRFF